MKNAITAILLLFGGALAFADGPCKDKREAKHAAKKELHGCVMSWAGMEGLESKEPSDDCSAKLAAFVQSAKDLHACRGQAKADRAAKKKGDKKE